METQTQNTTETKKQVIEKLINYYLTSGCDRYGQLGTISEGQIAKTDEEKKELNKIVKVGTYGYTYGTYKGFSAWGSFLDSNIEKLCKEAFSKNPARNNGNHW